MGPEEQDSHGLSLEATANPVNLNSHLKLDIGISLPSKIA